MPGVFRKRWFPTRRIKGLITKKNATVFLVGVSAFSAAPGFNKNTDALGVHATTQIGILGPGPTLVGLGDASVTALNAFNFFNTIQGAAGQFATTHAASLVASYGGNLNLHTAVATATANLNAFVALNATFDLETVFALSSGYFLGDLPEGRGGSLFGFPFSGQEGETPGLEVVAEISELTSTAPGARTFWIAGIQQNALSPGIVLFPTSEELSTGDAPYVLGSSQFYTVGEVHWNGTKRVQDTDWEFVEPFTHIIRLLVDPNTITTSVTFIYYRWDIGMRAGFEVTSFPVEFAFDRTSIIAERVPPLDEFFTVSYTENRPGYNPMTMYARYPVLIDDVLINHTVYDGGSGFDTYRPAGYTVFDISNNQVYTWDGGAWGSGVTLTTNTMFYSKRQRIIYVFDGTNPTPLYRTGDNIDGTYPETLVYPPFGESIGKNLLQDAFAADAQTAYPYAYTISLRPGFYDDWLEI